MTSPEFWISQSFNGVSYGALLFLLAGGLSLIFGMMRIVNMTHGSYYLLGGYVALTIIWRSGSFILGVLVGALAISLVGIAEWNAFLKRLSGQELGQVLTTMGFALIFQDLALVLWGGDPYTISIPRALAGTLEVGHMIFPVYRLFIIAVVVLVVLAIAIYMQRTPAGRRMRAVMQNRPLASVSGVRTKLVDRTTFFIGSGLAGLAGVGITLLGPVGPTLGLAYIIDAFLVVIVGGLGQLRGAILAALALGMANSFIEYNTTASIAKTGVFLLIVLFLQWRPQGMVVQARRGLAS